MRRILSACVATSLLLIVGSLAAETEVKNSDAFQKAWQAYQKGDSACVRQFETIAKDESATTKDRFNSEYILGVLRLASRDHEAARSHLARADALIPDRPQVDLRLAEAWLQASQPKKAVSHLKKAKKGAKKNKVLRLKYQLAMAELEIQSGATKHAKTRLERLQKKYRTSWTVSFKLGALHESADDAISAMAAYENVIANDPKEDPFPGIYAYQRWAALVISSDQGSYSKKNVVSKAIKRYRVFLDRAAANGVPEKLQETTRSAVWALENFAGG